MVNPYGQNPHQPTLNGPQPPNSNQEAARVREALDRQMPFANFDNSTQATRQQGTSSSVRRRVLEAGADENPTSAKRATADSSTRACSSRQADEELNSILTINEESNLNSRESLSGVSVNEKDNDSAATSSVS